MHKFLEAIILKGAMRLWEIGAKTKTFGGLLVHVAFAGTKLLIALPLLRGASEPPVAMLHSRQIS